MTSTRKVPPLIIFTLFFVSGATGLVYEVIWLRKLVLILGSTLFATSTILSTFMGGLALGAFAGGRLMDRVGGSPLRIYGVLEIGIGLYALGVPGLLRALTPFYEWVWNAGGSESFVVLSLAKFAGIAVVLLPPTVLMGASLPVLARQVADDPDRIGGKVGTLYAVNTFGAVFGTFVAGFVAIPAIGVRNAIWVTAAANVVLGLGALLVARGTARLDGASEPTETGTRVATRPAVNVVLLLTAFGVSGFAALALEVAWTRALALVLGSSVYAFSLMLLAFLVGLATGSALVSAVLRRNPRLNAGMLLASLMAMAGALAWATAFVLQRLPQIFGEIYFAWEPSPEGWFVVQFLLSLLVMFPATVAFGGIFPAVLQIHAGNLDRVSGSVGTVYAANTVGTIFGAAAAGFVLVPTLGVRNAIIATAAVEIAIALVVVIAVSGVERRRRFALATALATMLVGVAFVRPGWNPLLMNSGVYMNLQDLPAGSTWEDFVGRMMDGSELVYAREGRIASVLVADEPKYDNRYLAVNGKIEASTSADMETQLMISHLPLLLHDDPGSMMIIGLASGITVGAAATHPIDEIRVVEVEAAMVPAARLFDEHNGRVLDDPRVTLSINDARNELEFSARTYDVIASEPSNPWMTVASNLFTEEFFGLAKRRLEPGGIFCQWVQTYYLPPEDMRSIVNAFHASFPNVLIFQTFEGVDLLLLGSENPLRFDLERIEERMSELRVRLDLGRVAVDSPSDLLPLFLLGESEVERLVQGAARNTDDNARVEFSAPKAIYSDTLDLNHAMLMEHLADPLAYVLPPPESMEAEHRARLELAVAWMARGDQRRALEEARKALDGPLAAEARDLVDQLEL